MHAQVQMLSAPLHSAALTCKPVILQSHSHFAEDVCAHVQDLYVYATRVDGDCPLSEASVIHAEITLTHHSSSTLSATLTVTVKQAG